MRFWSSVCLSGVLACLSFGAVAQTVISRNNVLDDLEQAEKTDMRALATRGNAEALATFKRTMTTDEAILLQVLRPLLVSNGWVDCAQVRPALSKALSSVSTTTGLTAVMTMGMRVDALQCNASGIPTWTGPLPQALLNIQGRLPAEFGQTRARLARATPTQVVEASRTRVFANPDVGCMAPLMYQSRMNKERFQDAQRKAVSKCVLGR